MKGYIFVVDNSEIGGGVIWILDIKNWKHQKETLCIISLSMPIKLTFSIVSWFTIDVNGGLKDCLNLYQCSLYLALDDLKL